MKDIRGIFAPIPTLFKEDGTIDWDHLKANIERLGQSRLAGLVVMGSNGEFVSLLEEEKVELMKFVRKVLPAHKMMIAGTGCESAYATIRMNKAAADAGADAVLVLNPTYYKGALTPDGLKAHFTAVADASSLPVMIYNMPGNSSFNIPAAVTVALSKHPNIAGIKDSGGAIAQISEVIGYSKPGFSVFAGSGSFLMPTTIMGGKGGTLAVANIAPDFCAELFNLCVAGNYDKARQMQFDLIPLNAAVTAKFGVPGLKAAMEYLGYFGGPLRLPFLPLKEELKPALYGIIDEFQQKTGWNLKV